MNFFQKLTIYLTLSLFQNKNEVIFIEINYFFYYVNLYYSKMLKIFYI